jgi:hypothetical protein
MPGMTSTSVRDHSGAWSEKERTPIEKAMQREIQAAFNEFAPEAEEAVIAEEDPGYDKLKLLLTGILITYLVRAFMDQVAELETEYDIAFDPADMAAAANDWATGFAPEEAERLIATTRKVVSGVAAKYAAEEITRDQIEEMLEPAFNRNRAALIAITLITVALSRAFDDYVDGLRGLGVRVEIRWRTARDEMVCKHICAPLDGQPQEVWAAEYPSGPPAHPRCRCSREIIVVRE